MVKESRSKAGRKQKAVKYNTDRVATNIYSNLLRDFRASAGSAFYRNAEYAFLESHDAFRLNSGGSTVDIPVGLFKRSMQMDNLLKKYRFTGDKYTDAELSDRTFTKFITDQSRLMQPMTLKPTGFRVLQRARQIAARILGDIDTTDVVHQCRFGRKSSIGCSLGLAYIDNKLSVQRHFTSTKASSKFLHDQVLPGDAILRRILKSIDLDQDREEMNYAYLNLVSVPKTWKSYRLITPLTLVGLFQSYGVGRVITARLKDAGLDISKLQQTHRRLVRGFSRSMSHATADLSAASDSLTSELLNRVLPRPWYVALRPTFVRTIRHDQQNFASASVLPMGNGCTFPVETLVFYCIIKAIGELSGVDGIFSVYGDDLIYPSALHKYVVAIFPQLHLKLNVEKTFVSFPFRESCGSDFFRGQDVRSFYLKGESENLTRVRYEAFLYKVYNGLQLRWDPEEIRGTLHWLLTELANVTHLIKRVPPSYPDYSGVKVSTSSLVPLNNYMLPLSPVKLCFANGSRWFEFAYLVETPKKRIIVTQEPYYWLALQGATDEIEERNWWNTDYSFYHQARQSAVTWDRAVRKHSYYQNGRRVVKKKVRYTAVVASRTGATLGTARTSTESISDWL